MNCGTTGSFVCGRTVVVLNSTVCALVSCVKVGAALDFDLLKYNEDTLTGFLRVYSW